MTDDQQLFQALSKIDKRLSAIENGMATRNQVSSVYDLLDKNISEHQRQEEERAAMSAQLDRLNHSVREIAEKTGITLTYPS